MQNKALGGWTSKIFPFTNKLAHCGTIFLCHWNIDLDDQDRGPITKIRDHLVGHLTTHKQARTSTRHPTQPIPVDYRPSAITPFCDLLMITLDNYVTTLWPLWHRVVSAWWPLGDHFRTTLVLHLGSLDGHLVTISWPSLVHLSASFWYAWGHFFTRKMSHIFAKKSMHLLWIWLKLGKLGIKLDCFVITLW